MLTHVDAANRPTMVDVGDKAVTTRTAVARAVVVFPADVVLRSGEALRTKKGPVFDTAIIAESARWGDSKVATPRTKDDDWLPAISYIVDDYFPYRTDIVLAQLKNRGWFPSTAAPELEINGSS